MEARALRPYVPHLLVIALMAITCLALYFGVNVSLLDRPGIRMALPPSVGDWTGHSVRFGIDTIIGTHVTLLASSSNRLGGLCRLKMKVHTRRYWRLTGVMPPRFAVWRQLRTSNIWPRPELCCGMRYPKASRWSGLPPLLLNGTSTTGLAG